MSLILRLAIMPTGIHRREEISSSIAAESGAIAAGHQGASVVLRG
jgi:hypothetical protein